MTDDEIKAERIRINKALAKFEAKVVEDRQSLLNEWDALTKVCPHNDIYISPVCGTRVCRICNDEGV